MCSPDSSPASCTHSQHVPESISLGSFVATGCVLSLLFGSHHARNPSAASATPQFLRKRPIPTLTPWAAACRSDCSRPSRPSSRSGPPEDPRRRMRDQHALFGNGCPQHLVGRALLRSAQSAITDGLLDRTEASDIADLQSPGQRRDRTDSGDSSQSLQSLGQKRVTFRRTDPGIVQLLRPNDVFFCPTMGPFALLSQDLIEVAVEGLGGLRISGVALGACCCATRSPSDWHKGHCSRWLGRGAALVPPHKGREDKPQFASSSMHSNLNWTEKHVRGR
jgi:hypothetical protein